MSYYCIVTYISIRIIYNLNLTSLLIIDINCMNFFKNIVVFILSSLIYSYFIYLISLSLYYIISQFKNILKYYKNNTFKTYYNKNEGCTSKQPYTTSI